MSQPHLPALGLDVSKASLDLEVLSAHGRQRLHVPKTPVGFEQVQRWLKQLGFEQVHACLEATGTYSDAVACALVEQGHRVSIINPARVKAFRQSEGLFSKTDRQDAHVLWLFCEQKQPRAFHPPAVQVRALLMLLLRMEDVQQDGQRERNRLENQRWDEATRADIERHRAFLQQQWKQLGQRADQLVKAEPGLQQVAQQLDTIPGVARLSAMRLLALFADPSRFEQIGQLVAYSGLAPQQHQSGSSVQGQASIKKLGNPLVRKWLYMVAITAMTRDPDFRAWAQQLRARGKKSKQVIVAVMRKLLHIVYGMLKSGQAYDARKAFPSHHGPVQTPVSEAVA